MAMPLTLPSSEAHAKCGPDLTVSLSKDNDTHNDWKTVGSTDVGIQYERFVNEYDFVEEESEDTRLSVTLRIPLGEDYCEEQELARKNRDEAQAHRARLDNIEKKLRLCKQYGEHHPLLKGQCN